MNLQPPYLLYGISPNNQTAKTKILETSYAGMGHVDFPIKLVSIMLTNLENTIIDNQYKDL